MDFEKLGAFYLGKVYDSERGVRQESLLMYDARDLTTHAVCVGMTGSGKTGLGITLLEEAAIDRVPALIIDLKGDLTNLLLGFPELRPEDFLPWINEDDARRQGLSATEFAAQQAQTWRDGLAEWGQSGARIRMMQQTADFAVYTPGSDAGIPISILHSFNAPALSWDTDAESLRERIQGTVSALLGLLGIQAEPLRSREHILLSNLFEHFWRQGEDLDLARLILAVQTPPIRQLGVFDVETFFPAKERFDLAMSLNSIIAAPAFQSWLQGQPLDIPTFLSTAEGRPRHAIFYLAHLGDAERMFFVTLLLNALITWMRTQPGTHSLRALLYMDEMTGFFPPVANPPSKSALLTLLKQGRAFGVGCVLATQNPADLDYKGLTNAGTWFIGRLQTERDKDRLLDGLVSAAPSSLASDRQALERTLSSLGPRIFLMHNVHEPAPVVFESRWSLSYLRGPLTRAQLRPLSRPLSAATPQSPAVKPPPAVSQPPAASDGLTLPPVLPPEIQPVYLPLRMGAAEALAEVQRRGSAPMHEAPRLVYTPGVVGIGRVHFVKQRQTLNVTEARPFAVLAPAPSDPGGIAWERAQSLHLDAAHLLTRPEPQAGFAPLPESLVQPKSLVSLKSSLQDYLYHTASLTLWYSPTLKVYSQPGESERDFRMRLTHESREARDAEVDALEERYAQRLAALDERLRKARLALERKVADARARKQEAWLSTGEIVLGLFGHRRRSVAAVANRHNRSSTAQMDVDAAEDQVVALESEVQSLQQELKGKTDAIVARWEGALDALEELPIKPRRTDVEINLFTLAWIPCWRVAYQQGGAPVQITVIPAY